MAVCRSTDSGIDCGNGLALVSESDARTASPTRQKPAQFIRIVTCEFCFADHCSWVSDVDLSSSVHMLINSHEVEIEKVEQDSVKAISYAWGDFERTTRLIGHDMTGKTISMELGAEWNTEEFTSRLVLFTFEHGACWIDQLCIPQKDAEIRKALASVPTIYRTFDAIVVMPGTPCKCLRETLETLKVAHEFGTQSDYNSVVNSIESKIMECFNMLLCSSWFNRLWTRQELLYSRRISLAWTGTREAPCVTLGGPVSYDNYITAEHALDLSPYARLLHQQASQAVKTQSAMFPERFGMATVKKAVLSGNPSALVDLIPSFTNATVNWVLSHNIYGDTEVGRRLRGKAEEGRRLLESGQEKMTRLDNMIASSIVGISILNDYRSAIAAFREYVGARDEASEKARTATLRAFEFFAGEIVENDSDDPRSIDEKIWLESFLFGLGPLRGSGRTSTQAKDYVNAIWVDCPRFEVHASAKDLDLPHLLEDALNQLQLNHQVGIMTTVPAGLLGSDHRTGQWKPTLYLSAACVKDAAQVYGPMTHPVKPIPLTQEATIPLRVIAAQNVSLSWAALDYEDHLARYPTGAMFRSMKSVMSLWPPDLYQRNRVQEIYEPSDRLQGPATVGRFIAGILPSFVSNFTRAGFGGQDNFSSESQRRLNRYNGVLDARRQGMRDEDNFKSQLLEPRSSQWNSPAEVNHFQATYQVVTEALGLDYEMCRSRGLRLMVSWNPPRIGLADRHFPRRYARMRAGHISRDNLKTVCMAHGQGEYGSVLYEVEKIDRQGTPQYRVFGVWVPARGVSLDEVCAIAEHGATDAYIV